MTEQRWQQVKALFDRAIDCHPDARMGFIREICGGDQELLAEVQSLLAHDGTAESLFVSPFIQPGSLAAMAPAAPASVTDLMVGRSIGNYVITGPLARGGMGAVYRARHTSLPREVVVKCIRPMACSAQEALDLRIRFRREALIQSQLDHPGIVRVYEFFDGTEEYFLVMEYVPGRSLRAVLDERRVLGVGEACDLAAQALAGLSYAHRLSFVDEAGNSGTGMIHRDIKPANMLLDERGNLKLTDFGIAKLAGNEQMTKTGFSPGTAEYMAPEQIRGLPGDARSDLYSLGVTLYEMLAGCVPFPRTTSDSDYDVLRAHVETEPAPIGTLNAAIPPELAQVIDRSLRKNPDERWQSAAEFRGALPPFAGKLPSIGSAAAAGPGADVLASKPWLRRPWLKTAVIGALAIAVAGGAVWFGRNGHTPGSAQDQASIAVLPFTDLSPENNQKYFSEGLAEELLNELANTPGLRVTGKASSFGMKESGGDFAALGQKLNAAALLDGSVRKQGGRARITVQLIRAADGSRLWSDTFDRDMSDIFAIETEIARAVAGTLQVRLQEQKTQSRGSKSPNADAFNAYLQGRYFLPRRTEENLTKAVEYFGQAVKLEPGYAKAWVGLADARSGQAGAGYLPADDAYRLARDAVNRALVLDPNLGDAYAALGWIQQFHDSDWTGAQESYKKALALEPGNAVVISHAAILYRIVGRLDESVSLGRKATDIDPLSPGNFHNFGVTLYYAGMNQEAKAAFEKALELFPEMQNPHEFLGRVYLAMSQPHEALAEMEKEKNSGLRLFGLALAYHALGRRQESDANLAELIRQYRTQAGYQIGEVYGFRGEADRAFDALDDPGGYSQLKGDPLLKGIMRDPRYAALLKKARL